MKRYVTANSHGLTLLELLVVIAILGILSSFAVLAYNGYIDTTKNAAAETQIRELSILINDYALEYGVYPDSLADINNAHLRDPWGNPYRYLRFPDRLSGTPGFDLVAFSGEYGGEHDGDGDYPDDDRQPGNMGDVRKDRNLVPINSHYDLYSMGKDGQSRPPLTAPVSKDDIIYANDGAYVGLAEDY